MGPNSVTVSRIEPVYVYSNIYLMSISSHPPLYNMWLIDTGILTKKVICLLVMYYSTADSITKRQHFPTVETALLGTQTSC